MLHVDENTNLSGRGAGFERAHSSPLCKTFTCCCFVLLVRVRSEAKEHSASLLVLRMSSRTVRTPDSRLLQRQVHV